MSLTVNNLGESKQQESLPSLGPQPNLGMTPTEFAMKNLETSVDNMRGPEGNNGQSGQTNFQGGSIQNKFLSYLNRKFDDAVRLLKEFEAKAASLRKKIDNLFKLPKFSRGKGLKIMAAQQELAATNKDIESLRAQVEQSAMKALQLMQSGSA